MMARNLEKTARYLSWVTVIYNIVEGAASIAAGYLAGSIALTGFGMDSFVESLSGTVMIWRFSHKGARQPERTESIERRAVKLVAYSFFILSVWILYESVSKLITREMPDPTIFGIAVATVSALVMPVLFVAKYRTGKAIGSRALVADSKETLACEFLSVSLLAGLGLNYLYGLWWADPAVGIIIALFLIHEGREILEDEDDNDNDNVDVVSGIVNDDAAYDGHEM